MSFFSGIESVFASVGTWFKKHVLNSNWSQNALVAINVAAPFVEDLVALYGGPVADAAVTSVMNEIKRDLGTAQTVLTQINNGTASGSATTQLQNVLTSINQNLAALLAAGHISNTDTVAKITSTTNLITGEIGAIVSAIPTTS